MKSILLIGLGRFGKHIAFKLHELGHQVLAVDRVEERVDESLSFIYSGQIGDSTDKDFLKQLGIRDFDVCLVTIADDFQSSLITASNLKELGAARIIARADRDVQKKFLLMAGADEIVYPEEELGHIVAVRCSSDHVFDYVELDEGYAIFEIDIPESWIGKTLVDLDVRRKYSVTIIAVKRNEKMTVNIDVDEPFAAGDRILVVGSEADIHRKFRL
jgi:trk system potassium uptake protein TrkA